MKRRTDLLVLVLLAGILTLTQAQVMLSSANSNSNSNNNGASQQVVMLATVKDVLDLSTPAKILKSLAVPGFSSRHGYNYVALEGWSCQGSQALPLKIWQNPNTYLNNSINTSDNSTRNTLKNLFKTEGVKILANAFSNLQNPISGNLSASQCAIKLAKFLTDFSLDGANIDLTDGKAIKDNSALGWLNQFFLQLQFYKNLTFTLTVDVSFLNQTTYSNNNLQMLEKTVGKVIQFYVFRYFDSTFAFNSYKDIFQGGELSVQQLIVKGFPINKIVVGKTSLYNQTGFVPGSQLLDWFKNAHIGMSWNGGLSVSPFIEEQAKDQLRQVVKRRDVIQPIIATNLDKVNFWWPPQKTIADIGVPSYAPNNRYNYFIFGTWSCQNGAFDIARLWSNPYYYFSTNFGTSNAEIQAYLKSKYKAAGKKIVVRAFGDAQSPTTGGLDPVTCGKSLAAFVLSNNLDGVDLHYKDNTAFNSGTAQQWVINFSNTLRNLLPFHIISHSVQDYLLNRAKYIKGGYQTIISQIGYTIDFYTIVYYGQQHTNLDAFDTYNQLFLNSGPQFPQTSVTQLVNRGFQLNKIVIGKPNRLYDAQGAGYVNSSTLRQTILRASAQLGWRGGICYSSYINDQDGTVVLDLLRGMDRSSSIRFAYVNNVNVWWPPQATIGQMGVPTLAPANLYNYFAYAFWTYSQGPLAITKLYNDPVTYLGTELGKNKTQLQSYIFSFYKNNSIKLLVSSFGDSEFPVKAGIDPIQCADKLIQYALNNQLDGLDIDFEDSQSFINGAGENWLIVFTRQLRASLPFHIISHAPQAPYFSPDFAPTGSYLTVNKHVGKFIDFYNIQFYNQGNNTKYDTYSSLFVDSGIYNANSSVFQIIAQGIAPQKVVLGKPVRQADAFNTGFVEASNLNSMLKQAVADKANPSWKPSIMYWNFLSDLKGQTITTVLNGI